MSGTSAGAKKAAKTLKEQDADFYRKLGRLGGLMKVPKGFAINRQLASEAGRKGGSAPRRTKGSVLDNQRPRRRLRGFWHD